MQKEEELVSIIMPSYNTANFISESIESVLKQSYQNWELIIVDDCSTDNTNEVIKKYMNDKRIIFFKNTLNMGAAFTRNYALEIAKGRWIAFLDSDDLWMPNKLEKQISFMKDNHYSFSYTYYDEMDENGNRLCRKIYGPKKINKLCQYAYCWQGCLTVMYDSNIIGDIHIENIKKNNDYAMWLKVCERSNCYLLNELLAHYRKRTGSISNHNYISLIMWQYNLWHEAEKKNIISSVFLTLLNLLCGCYKKIRFKKVR